MKECKDNTESHKHSGRKQSMGESQGKKINLFLLPWIFSLMMQQYSNIARLQLAASFQT